MRICVTQNRPRFEVLQWPESELEAWSIYFSIQDNGDKPNKAELIDKATKSISVKESKAQFKELMW